jgi:hypothetical protein
LGTLLRQRTQAGQRQDIARILVQHGAEAAFEESECGGIGRRSRLHQRKQVLHELVVARVIGGGLGWWSDHRRGRRRDRLLRYDRPTQVG